MQIESILLTPLDSSVKGLPGDADVSPAAVAAKKWNVLREDLHLPLMVLKESALAHNIQAMAHWCAANHYLLAPHGKTTMCPQIYRRQIDAGAWGITVANMSQALICARFGVPRILIANQVVGRGNIRSLVSILNAQPQLECYCLIDSVEAARHLAAHMEQSGARRPVQVLLEWGREGWRTGVRSVEQATQVHAEIARRERYLAFRGLEAFEGLAHEPGEAAGFLEDLLRLTQSIPHQQPLLFSIGGTAFLDQVAQAIGQLRGAYQAVVRSGCYVTHDHGFYGEKLREAAARSAQVPQFRPAFELWSYVQSLPDPHRAILTFGKRDCSFDIGLPKPLFALPPDAPLESARCLDGCEVTNTNDQHAYLSYPVGVPLQVGDRICCGISHPCTAFDKWRVVPVVDDAYNVIDLYRTYF